MEMSDVFINTIDFDLGEFFDFFCCLDGLAKEPLKMGLLASKI